MDYQVPQYCVKSLAHFLMQQGIEKQQILKTLATDEVSFSDAKTRYNLSTYDALLAEASRILKIENIGFHFGQAFELGIWGILGHIVVAAPNLEQALYYQKRYQCLIGNVGQAEHEINDNVLTMRYISHPAASKNNIEHVITAWLTFAFSYTRSTDAPISIHFTHQCLTKVEEYQAFFRCPVIFGDDFNGVKIHIKSLTHQIVSSNSDVLNVLIGQAEQQLANKRQSASMDIIREYIIEQLPKQLPSLEDVANHLDISVRQLQRQFQKEQINLTLLVESIRQQLAISYLTQTNHKLIYISSILGYSEQSAFQRAFKRWFDVTPQAYRLQPTAIELSQSRL